MVARLACCLLLTALMMADESRRFPVTDRVGMQAVERKMLGKDFLPGGNLAEYRHGAKKWQQFLVRGSSPQNAAMMLFDLKGTLKSPKYLAYMGGYFGYDGTKPVYIFAKGVYLAGVIGLPEKEADVLARQFAARLE